MLQKHLLFKEHHINNEKGLVVELNKYKFQIFKSKKNVCGSFYYKSSHSNFHVTNKGDLGWSYNKGQLTSILNGIQKTWSTIGYGFSDYNKYGFYLSSETNYKNGEKHGLSLEWKNDSGYFKSKKYFYKPKIVFVEIFIKE